VPKTTPKLSTFFYGASTIDKVDIISAIFVLDDGTHSKIYINSELAGRLVVALTRLKQDLAVDSVSELDMRKSRELIQKRRDDFNPNNLLSGDGYMMAVTARINVRTIDAVLTFVSLEGATRPMLVKKAMIAELLAQTERGQDVLQQLHAQRQTRH
jgi:hypothetical protein